MYNNMEVKKLTDYEVCSFMAYWACIRTIERETITLEFSSGVVAENAARALQAIPSNKVIEIKILGRFLKLTRGSVSDLPLLTIYKSIEL